MSEIIRPMSLRDLEVALTVLAEAGRSPDQGPLFLAYGGRTP